MTTSIHAKLLSILRQGTGSLTTPPMTRRIDLTQLNGLQSIILHYMIHNRRYTRKHLISLLNGTNNCLRCMANPCMPPSSNVIRMLMRLQCTLYIPYRRQVQPRCLLHPPQQSLHRTSRFLHCPQDLTHLPLSRCPLETLPIFNPRRLLATLLR